MRYSLLLAEDGGILDDLMITNTGEHIALVVNGACKWDDIAFLREHLPDEITLTHHDEQALLALQGPEAVDALGELVPGAAELVFMTAGYYDWNGVPLWISRAGYTGEDGFEISVPAEHAEKLATALVEDKRVKPIGLGARDSLRLEAGLPLYGHDLTAEIDPVSADLTFALSKKRRETGGYHGHEHERGGQAEGDEEQAPRPRVVGPGGDHVGAARARAARARAAVEAPLVDTGAAVGLVTSMGVAEPSMGQGAWFARIAQVCSLTARAERTAAR